LGDVLEVLLLQHYFLL